MVRKASLGCLSLILALSACTLPAGAVDLCPSLAIPTDLGLACAPATDIAPGAVAVTPAAGTSFGGLSQLSLRPLDRTQDPLAWSDPTAWLQRQMTVDTSSYAGVLGGAADDPDSPFAGAEAKSALNSFVGVLQGLGRLPLNACDTPLEQSTGRWSMGCRFTMGGIGMLMQLRLVADGDRRWGMTLRAANEQRLRHFEAIANSFTPPPA